MTEELKNQPQADRPAYVPPRAMRMGDSWPGTGACDTNGSGDAVCNACGYSALDCASNGCCALSCIAPGDSATASCDGTGNDPHN